MNRFDKIVRTPGKYFKIFLVTILSKFYFIPDKPYLKVVYRLMMNRKLNLDNPRTFNEKIQWLKLYDRKPEYTMMVDKAAVKEYVAHIIGEEHIIPTIGVYNNFDEIDFEKLPEQFVMKCTHDSGGLVICRNKLKLDIKAAKKKINFYLRRRYFYCWREWPYKGVKPRIIVEKYMEDKDGGELHDYKLLCFNGKVKCSFVCLDRNRSGGLRVDFYDSNWTKMPFERHYHNSETNTPRPVNYKKMVTFTELLSQDISFTRIDYYEVNGNLYFGEITFYPGSGIEEFTPEEWDYTLGSWIQLPEI